MVKAEVSGTCPVNRPKGKRPQRQKRRLKRIRDKGEWYKRPNRSAESSPPDPVAPGLLSEPVTLGKCGSNVGKNFVSKSGKKAEKKRISTDYKTG